MLDRALKPFYSASATPIYMGKLEQYVTTLTTRRIQIVGQRYSQTPGRESRGVVLLRHALAFAEPQSIRERWSNDIDRIASGLLPIVDDIERLFDPVTTGTLREEVFIARRAGLTTEVLIPARSDDPLQRLPIGKGWAAWQYVKPIRIIDIQSNELTFNAYMDQIVFKHDQPPMAVFAIDVVALVMQYVKYLDLYNGAPPDTVQEYLHKYVLSDSLLEDLQNLWLRNRYLHMLKNPDVKITGNDDITASIYHGIYGYIGTQYTQAMEEVQRMIKRYQHGTTVPDRVLASFVVSDGKLPAYVQQMRAATSIPNTRQHYWVELLRDLTWLHFVYHTYSLNTDFVGYTSFMRQFKRDVGLLMNTRFWTSILRTDIRDRVKNAAAELLVMASMEDLAPLLHDDDKKE